MNRKEFCEYQNTGDGVLIAILLANILQLSNLTLKELLKEKANEGKIIFFSTHVLDVAEKLCNRIAIIKDGKLLVDGDMDRIIKDKSLEETFMELVVDE